jgi:hypothetical protein
MKLNRLDRDVAAQNRILGEIDDAHGTAAEYTADAKSSYLVGLFHHLSRWIKNGPRNEPGR